MSAFLTKFYGKKAHSWSGGQRSSANSVSEGDAVHHGEENRKESVGMVARTAREVTGVCGISAGRAFNLLFRAPPQIFGPKRSLLPSASSACRPIGRRLLFSPDVVHTAALDAAIHVGTAQA